MALVLTGLLQPLIGLFTNVAEVRVTAGEYALWAGMLPLVSVMAFQLDGIFIGATEGGLMRNAMVAATAIFVPLGLLLTQTFGNHGLWAALWVWMLLRAGTLALYYPQLEARAGM